MNETFKQLTRRRLYIRSTGSSKPGSACDVNPFLSYKTCTSWEIRPTNGHQPIQSIGLYHPLRNVTFNLLEMLTQIIEKHRYNEFGRIFPDHPRQRQRNRTNSVYSTKKFQLRGTKLSRRKCRKLIRYI